MKSPYMKFGLNHVVAPQENYRGLSYGIWAAAFWNWLLSDLKQGGSVYFLRGNVDLESAIVKTGKERVTIYSDTAIFFPIICTITSKLSHPNETSDMMRRNHSVESAIEWLLLKTTIDDAVIPNLENFYAETPEFILSVPKSSILRKQFDPIFKIGTGPAVSAGYWILLKPLPIGEHTIKFEGSYKEGLKTSGSGFKTSGNYTITVLKRPATNSEII
jgi:hypothetical protein